MSTGGLRLLRVPVLLHNAKTPALCCGSIVVEKRIVYIYILAIIYIVITSPSGDSFTGFCRWLRSAKSSFPATRQPRLTFFGREAGCSAPNIPECIFLSSFSPVAFRMSKTGTIVHKTGERNPRAHQREQRRPGRPRVIPWSRRAEKTSSKSFTIPGGTSRDGVSPRRR